LIRKWTFSNNWFSKVDFKVFRLTFLDNFGKDFECDKRIHDIMWTKRNEIYLIQWKRKEN
jgi:hypothetical protein